MQFLEEGLTFAKVAGRRVLPLRIALVDLRGAAGVVKRLTCRCHFLSIQLDLGEPHSSI